MSTSLQRESCCCTPKSKIQKKKKKILQHCKSLIHQYEIQITKRACQLYSPQALVTWAPGTSLKPGSPGWTVVGLTELGEMCWPMSPAPWACMPAPLCTGPQSPDPGHPPAPTGCGVSGLGELRTGPWAPCLPVLGFPPPASFLGVAPPVVKAPQRVVLQKLGCVQGVGVRKAGGMGHKPWVFLPALCSLDSPGTGLSLRLWFPPEQGCA